MRCLYRRVPAVRDGRASEGRCALILLPFSFLGAFTTNASLENADDEDPFKEFGALDEDLDSPDPEASQPESLSAPAEVLPIQPAPGRHTLCQLPMPCFKNCWASCIDTLLLLCQRVAFVGSLPPPRGGQVDCVCQVQDRLRTVT
jgi:hypothetical protein